MTFVGSNTVAVKLLTRFFFSFLRLQSVVCQFFIIYQNSDIVHTFSRSVLHIDFSEVGLDVVAVSSTAIRMADSAAGISAGGFVIALAVWVNVIQVI